MAVTRRRTYTEADKALIYAELTINEGNIKKTARNLDMPISTIRYYKSQWGREGISQEIIDAVPTQVNEFVNHAERVRDKLLIALERSVDRGEIKPREIVVALGMITDKIRAMRGLDTKKVEHTIALPDVEEMRELFSGVIGEVVGAAEVRNSTVANIEEGDWEPANMVALPRPTEVKP